MRCSPRWTRGLFVLAASILLLSHPHWITTLGRRRATDLARTLAPPFAAEYLIPNAGADWIISSSTVREFAEEALGDLPAPARSPAPSRSRHIACQEEPLHECG